MPKILLTNHYSPEPLELVKTLIPQEFELISLSRPDQNELIEKAFNADYFLAGGRVRINARLLDSAPKLRMIQRSGVGLDAIDLAELKIRGIPLYVNKGVNAQSVAEHTIMLMLGTLRRLNHLNTMTRSGRWVKHDLGIHCHSLYGQQVGLVGLGDIGTQVCEMLKGFGVRVVYYKRNRLAPAQERRLGATYVSLDELLKNSGVVSLHCSLNDETTAIIGQKQLASMRATSVLINTARGQLVDEDALIRALHEGMIAGAGLDVFAEEPLPKGHSLLKMNNVLITPHVSSITAQTFRSMMEAAFKNIELFHNGDYQIISECRVT